MTPPPITPAPQPAASPPGSVMHSGVSTDVQLQAAVTAFLDGPWAQLVTAKDTLHDALSRHFEQPDIAMAPYVHYPDFTPAQQSGEDTLTSDQLLDLLASNRGLTGEFSNGLEASMARYLKENGPSANKPIAQRVLAFMERAGSRSELATDIDNERKAQSDPAIAVEESHRIGKVVGAVAAGNAGYVGDQETKIQALTRIADSIARWRDVNAATLSTDEKTALESGLDAYRSALAEVNAFVNNVKASPYYQGISEQALKDLRDELTRPNFPGDKTGALTTLLGAKKILLSHVPHQDRHQLARPKHATGTLQLNAKNPGEVEVARQWSRIGGIDKAELTSFLDDPELIERLKKPKLPEPDANDAAALQKYGAELATREKAIEDYRAALPPVLDYIDKVKRHMQTYYPEAELATRYGHQPPGKGGRY